MKNYRINCTNENGTEQTIMVKYENFNANPKGRKTTDCVIRALSVATCESYNEVYDELVKISKDTGYMINKKRVYERYLAKKGFIKVAQPRKADGTKYLIGEVRELTDGLVIVVSMANHLTTIRGDKLVDTCDSRYKTIENYYIRLGARVLGGF